MTRRANPNSAPPAGRPRAQIRPPIAATRRAHTKSPIPAPVAESSGLDGHWSSAAFAGSLSHSSFDGGSFSSGFASQVAPESSSGGGGGFSGGGGGFSGGGGGGSW